MDDRTLPRGIGSASGPVIVHFDGACQKVAGGPVATFGFTVEGAGYDHEDRGLAVPPHHERATNNVAEYVAAIRALEWLRGQGYAGEVVVRGDSQLVAEQMAGTYQVRAEHLRPYHDWLAQLAGGFARVEFQWIRREENVRADALSKTAIRDAAPEVRRPSNRTDPGSTPRRADSR